MHIAFPRDLSCLCVRSCHSFLLLLQSYVRVLWHRMTTYIEIPTSSLLELHISVMNAYDMNAAVRWWYEWQDCPLLGVWMAALLTFDDISDNISQWLLGSHLVARTIILLTLSTFEGVNGYFAYTWWYEWQYCRHVTVWKVISFIWWYELPSLVCCYMTEYLLCCWYRQKPNPGDSLDVSVLVTFVGPHFSFVTAEYVGAGFMVLLVSECTELFILTVLL